MPKKRPYNSGYARIAQAEEEEEEEQAYTDDDDPFTDRANAISEHGPEFAPIQPQRRNPMRMPDQSGTVKRQRRKRANSGVDIKAINARLERWAEEIKERFTRRRIKGKSAVEEHFEIHHSVFTAPDWIRPATKETLEQEYDADPQEMSKLEFDDIVESVRVAIEIGMQPTLISQGSSGSYFARNSGGKIMGVFKPKTEEPYGNQNPKWTKWLHRNLLPFAFGRAMLIPNLSYVSEAAAYVLDCQLRTHIVPYTDVVSLSSTSFHYDWMDWRAYRRKKRPLPEKIGSFQVFLKGYKGATDFLREHPWPDTASTSFRDAPSQKRNRRRRWDETCRPGSAQAAQELSEDEDDGETGEEQDPTQKEFWTDDLQLSFRTELEKLVILDYIMRNTDRGSDNWMIRIDQDTQQATIVKEPPQNGYARRADNMTVTPDSASDEKAIPRIGAIDNSLSWPWKHPDAWRSYPFGWLFLPVSLIGRPFSEHTRRHFLPLLTSKDWWSDTQVKLRRCFEIDADFKERMFARQMAVMKGQAWNVVETLKTPDHGPLELTRRSRVLVWDDLVDIPVAVPLPRASEEMRKRAAATRVRLKGIEGEVGFEGRAVNGADDNEMDISSALQPSTPAANGDLLSLSAPSNKNRFNHSRHNSAQDIHQESPVTPQPLSDATRPGAYRSRTGGVRAPDSRKSHDLPRAAPWQSPTAERRRRFSWTMRRNTFGAGGTGYDDDDDDMGGDLGYAAAATQEQSLRTVIVERLEMVKAKTPFFQWC